MLLEKTNSPVILFYETLEAERRRAEEEAKKTKRGRPRKNKMYFTNIGITKAKFFKILFMENLLKKDL